MRTTESSFSQLNDQFSGVVPDRLPADVVKRLSQLSVWRAPFEIGLQWAYIFSIIYVAHSLHNAFVLVLAVILIGARQHALAILMHDGAHYRLLPNRKANEVIGEVCLAWPLFVSMKTYRQTHFAHHRNPNTEKDPDWALKTGNDWCFPKTKIQLALMLAQTACGGKMSQSFKRLIRFSRMRDSTTAAPHFPTVFIVRATFYATCAAAIWYFGVQVEFILYWLIPMFTWLQLVLKVRSIAEHFCVNSPLSADQTRTTIATVFDKVCIASHNICYHFDHHWYPSVPFYRLPELHEHLLKQPGYMQRAQISHGYFRALLECVATDTSTSAT